ncbi:hypothetical protein ACPA9J_12235 [Pseudomonas aeruginosa]
MFGLDSPLSNVAAVFHIINHATFKARCSWPPGSSTTRPAAATCA